MASKSRSYICSGCKGVVSLPPGSKRFTLEYIKNNHSQTCPTRRAIK